MQAYKNSIIYYLFYGLILMTSCNGQNKVIQNNTLAKGETAFGLDHKIWKIYQDQNNHYWFGSNGNGVFYYDGQQLLQYTRKDGLVNNTIRSIQGDHLGNVFIGTPVGVSKYDGKTFTTLVPMIASANEWKLQPNDLWFNCNGNALYRYDGEKLWELSLPQENLAKVFGIEVQGVSFPNMNDSPYAVYGLDKDKAGNLWIGTVTAGAFRYDGNSFLWVSEKELSELPDGRVPGVRSMLEDKDGNMWLSNFISKYRISGDGSSYEKLVAIDPANELLQDRLPYFNSGLTDEQGNLWMTTYGGGVWKYDGQELHNFPIKTGVTDALLTSIYQDNQGVLWLGTDNVGVFRYNGERFEHFEPMRKEHNTTQHPIIIGTPPPLNPAHNPYNDVGLVSQYIRSIFQDSKGNFWFGPAGQSVVKYDGDTLNYYSKKEFFQGNAKVDRDNGLSVHAIAEDKNGHIWFGTNYGAVKYDGKTFCSYTEENGLSNTQVGRNSIFVDESNTVWVGTQGGVFRYNSAADSLGGQCFSLFSLVPPIHVKDIMEDQNGHIWFASQNKGVFRYDGKGMENITAKEGLGDNVAGGMAQDKAGNYWFTMKGGICRYDGKEFTEYTTKDGLGGSEIWGIYMEESGIIWITARGSTTRFDPAVLSSSPEAFTVFRVADGLNCCVQSMYQDKAGHMWWGAGQGLYRFDGKGFYQVKQNGPWAPY